VGSVIAINGRIFGMDVLGRDEIFRKVFPKLMTGYALDAIDLAGDKPSEIDSDSIGRLLSGLRSANFEEYRSPGIGTDVRISSEEFSGHALVVDGSLVHLAVFPSGSV
jgi:hypothetical protein